MRQWMFLCMGLCCMLTACFSRVEQGRDDLSGGQPDAEALRQDLLPRKADLKKDFASYTAEQDTVDHLHSSMTRYNVSRASGAVDTIYHYPIGRKIEVGMHYGDKLFLELGEFYDDLIYNGAKIYWGDSLIYATGLEVANDWQTCHVHHVDSTDITYVLLLIDDRPNPPFWHIVCMNGTDIHLADYVMAGCDYREGGRYFHDSLIYEDLDGDGIIEVGGKYYTELWADSMTYQPCYIYKLGPELKFDEVTSERETRNANKGVFLGFKDGLSIYNPDETQHEKRDED